MKNPIPSVAVLLTLSTGLMSVAAAAATNRNPNVNAYGEPAGFSNLPELPLPDSKDLRYSSSLPGACGLHVLTGYVDKRHFESSGSWQDRIAAEMPGTVIIGPLEVLDSGPTGPMPADALIAAREEVTGQVLGRIKATDRIMASLKSQSKSLDKNTQARFSAAAAEVAARRHVLREDLKTVRAASDDQWSSARASVAVSFNAYVESTHRAQEAITSQNL